MILSSLIYYDDATRFIADLFFAPAVYALRMYAAGPLRAKASGEICTPTGKSEITYMHRRRVL